MPPQQQPMGTKSSRCPPDPRRALWPAALCAHTGRTHGCTDQCSAAYIGRRHQSHGVAERLELPRPMVRRGAGFNAYQAWRQFLKERQDIAALHLPPDDYSWTWNTDLAMSRPIVVTVCMLGSSKLRGLNSIRIHGTHVPVDEPSTASRAGIARRFQLLRRDAIRFSLPQAEVLDRGRQRL